MRVFAFQNKIYDHFIKEKRVFPWRKTRDPYKILVSEMMLQQTQAERVVPKYETFLKQFPSVHDLSRASVRDVLLAWQGLGYNRRALLLKRAAEEIVTVHAGKFPKTYDELVALPGIGPYTASAIMVFAYNEPQVVIETNIRSVFIYFFFQDEEHVPDTKLLPLIEAYMDTNNPRDWYNALMDYGSYLKKTMPNPSRRSKQYIKQSSFKGSDRQVRGAIIKAYTENPKITKAQLFKLPYEKERITAQFEKLKKEGFFQ